MFVLVGIGAFIIASIIIIIPVLLTIVACKPSVKGFWFQTCTRIIMLWIITISIISAYIVSLFYDKPEEFGYQKVDKNVSVFLDK